MKECKKIHKDLVAFLYGELETKERERLLSHLKSCSQCQREVEGLREVKRSADSLHKDINEVMASVNWDTLPAQVTEAVFEEETQEQKESWFTRISTLLLQPKLRPVYASLIVGILLGSVLTLMIFRTPFIKQVKRGEFYMPQEYIERVELEMARRETLDYLDKSQYLILDFIQASTEEEPSLWQRKFASQRAKNLLSKKKYINPQLNTFQMAKAKEICDQIEFLFYELAQISDQVPAWRLKEILNLIEKKQILLKIKLLKKELEKTEKSEV